MLLSYMVSKKAHVKLLILKRQYFNKIREKFINKNYGNTLWF